MPSGRKTKGIKQSKIIMMYLRSYYKTSVKSVKFSSHFEHCSAPICFETIKQDGVSDVIWYPSELVCLKNGLSAPAKYVQKVQRRINKLVTKGKFKNVDRAFTFEMISKIKNVTTATKGLNPERPLELKRFETTQLAPNSISSKSKVDTAGFLPGHISPAPFESINQKMERFS